MKKIILKRTRYHKLPETVFGIVVSMTFFTLSLLDILSGERKVSDSNLIGGFVFLPCASSFTYGGYLRRKLKLIISILIVGNTDYSVE